MASLDLKEGGVGFGLICVYLVERGVKWPRSKCFESTGRVETRDDSKLEFVVRRNEWAQANYSRAQEISTLILDKFSKYLFLLIHHWLQILSHKIEE